jgi:integrase
MHRSSRIPSYRLHKQSGQAIVTLTDPSGARHDVLLGPHDTPQSRAEYARVIGEWELNGRQLAAAPDKFADITVNEVLLAYHRHAEGYYVKDGQPTTQLDRVSRSLCVVREMYGHTKAAEFGPLALKTVRQKMIEQGLCRRVINQRIGCVKLGFKWAVAEELVPASVLHGLQAVPGLRAGRCDAPDHEPIGPVALAVVEATLPHLHRHLAGMVRFQMLTGARPCEVGKLRAADLDTSGRIWLYRPTSHKTKHHGKDRVIAVGPRAQEVLKEFLTADAESFVFSPAKAMVERVARLRERRKSKVQPSQQCRRKKKPRRIPGERYDSAAYGHAIRIACERAGLPVWAPNQLRRLHGTEVRKQFGLEAAQVALGHSQADVTQIYAERNLSLAVEVATKIG